ncbi:hypothetical protein D3C80_1457720 [compost metagenome]
MPVNQSDRHTINLGLHPQIVTAVHPLFYGTRVAQFTQSGVGHRMRYFARWQWPRILFHCTDTTPPILQLLQQAVVELVVDWAVAQAIISLIPSPQLIIQRRNFRL